MNSNSEKVQKIIDRCNAMDTHPNGGMKNPPVLNKDQEQEIHDAVQSRELKLSQVEHVASCLRFGPYEDVHDVMRGIGI